MIIKGYWEVQYISDSGHTKGKKIIKAKNVQKAVDQFYGKGESWFAQNGYVVVSVEPHSVKMIVNENE